MKKQVQSILLICLTAMMLAACTASRLDKVETPAAMNMQRGRNYREVVEDFEDKGFTNIRLESIEDLRYGWIVKYEEVEEISVGGDTNYDAGVLVPADTEVVIRYHTYMTGLEEETEGTENTGATADTAEAEKTAEKTEKKKDKEKTREEQTTEAEKAEKADSASTEAAPALEE